MVQLDLTRDETGILIKMLENYLSELRMEIADTDQQDFRDQLKEEKRVLLKTLKILREKSSRTVQV